MGRNMINSLRWLLASCLGLLATDLSAEELFGSFEDKSVQVTCQDESEPEVVSLHALFNLDFGNLENLASYSDTHHLELTVKLNHFDVTIQGNEGQVLGTQFWITETFETAESEGKLIRIQSAEVPDNSYILQLETERDKTLLKARVVYLHASTFGPKLTEFGSYYFTRLPPKIADADLHQSTTYFAAQES